MSRTAASAGGAEAGEDVGVGVDSATAEVAPAAVAKPAARPPSRPSAARRETAEPSVASRRSGRRGNMRAPGEEGTGVPRRPPVSLRTNWVRPGMVRRRSPTRYPTGDSPRLVHCGDRSRSLPEPDVVIMRPPAHPAHRPIGRISCQVGPATTRLAGPGLSGVRSGVLLFLGQGATVGSGSRIGGDEVSRRLPEPQTIGQHTGLESTSSGQFPCRDGSPSLRGVR
jgi:hypothetical protein